MVPVALHAEPQCLTAPYDHVQTADQRVVASLLRGLHPVITASPSLTTALAEHRPVFCLDDLAEGVDGFFNVEEARIVLRRDLTPELQSVFLLHELRHLEQFGQGLCPSSGILSLEDHAFVLLALEADASAVSTLRAWQRLLEGDPGLWEVMVNWPSQADIAIRLGRAFFAGDSEAQMTAAAFEQWYLQEDRSQRYRSQTCHDYLESTAAKGAQPLHDLSIGEFLQRLCVLPDGASYGCIVPEGPPG